MGNISGVSLYHLRASRKILLHLREMNASPNTGVLGFLSEIYAFQAITSNITSKKISGLNRRVPADDLLSSLTNLNDGTSHYGFLFGAAHELFELIPQIAQSAEENESARVSETGCSTVERYYEDKIMSWRCSLSSDKNGSEDSEIFRECSLAGQIYQQALLIFLYTMFHGERCPDQSLFDKVDPCIARSLDYREQVGPMSTLQTKMMWPTLIVGSCMRDKADRDKLLTLQSELYLSMAPLTRSAELLVYVWEDHDCDSRCFGIYGLAHAMEKREFNICVG